MYFVFVRHAVIQNFVEVSNGDSNLNNIFFPIKKNLVSPG